MSTCYRSIFSYNYVAGVSGDGESRGFVGAMREKAAGACVERKVLFYIY